MRYPAAAVQACYSQRDAARGFVDMAHIDDGLKPRSLTDRIIESEIVFNVTSALSLILVVPALLLWGLARAFRAAISLLVHE